MAKLTYRVSKGCFGTVPTMEVCEVVKRTEKQITWKRSGLNSPIRTEAINSSLVIHFKSEDTAKGYIIGACNNLIKHFEQVVENAKSTISKLEGRN